MKIALVVVFFSLSLIFGVKTKDSLLKQVLYQITSANNSSEPDNKNNSNPQFSETEISEKNIPSTTTECKSDVTMGKYRLVYSGGMRFSGRKYGEGSVKRATPIIAVDQDKIWIGGQTNKNIVGAFELDFSNEMEIHNFPVAKNLVPFIRVDTIEGWPEKKRLSGIETIGDDILISLTEYYDANGDAPYSHVVLRGGKELEGWLKTDARLIAHTSGWIASLPEKWRKQFNAQYLMGNAENYPIASRHSNGPSLYTWNGKIDRTMQVTPYLYYSLRNPLHNLRYNRNDIFFNKRLKNSQPTAVADNNLWTVVSQAWGGFIVGDDYIVLGASGMYSSSGGYKITDKDGNKCGGPCAFDPKDYYNHYWIYDMNDIISAPHLSAAKPYSWGKLELGFAENLIYGNNSNGLIKGVDFDGTYIYLALKNGDTSQPNQKLPLLLRYKLCE